MASLLEYVKLWRKDFYEVDINEIWNMKFRMSLVDALISVFLEKVANISYELTSRRDYPNHFAKLNIVSIRGKNHL
jgi:hypothetical protein